MIVRLLLSMHEINRLQRAAKTHPMCFTDTLPELADKIGLVMRSKCPVPGAGWDKFMTVLLEPGERIDEHAHKRHTVLFYPRACEPLEIAGKPFTPDAGQVIHLPPNVPHAVPKVSRARLSVAMLVPDA